MGGRSFSAHGITAAEGQTQHHTHPTDLHSQHHGSIRHHVAHDVDENAAQKTPQAQHGVKEREREGTILPDTLGHLPRSNWYLRKIICFIAITMYKHYTFHYTAICNKLVGTVFSSACACSAAPPGPAPAPRRRRPWAPRSWWRTT